SETVVALVIALAAASRGAALERGAETDGGSIFSNGAGAGLPGRSWIGEGRIARALGERVAQAAGQPPEDGPAQREPGRERLRRAIADAEEIAARRLTLAVRGEHAGADEWGDRVREARVGGA